MLAAVADDHRDFIYRDDSMAHVVKLAQQIAPSDASVLITGESAPARKLLGGYVHAKSNRARAAFISVNCAAIPEHLLESRTVRHEKAPSRGAVARRIGKFEEASGGTLLLDEISEIGRAPAGEAPARHPGARDRPRRRRQAGAGRHPHHRDLEPQPGGGREGGNVPRGPVLPLSNVVNLKIPPLRERPADVLELADHFVKMYARRTGWRASSRPKRARN